MGFTLNPYNLCVANKEIDGSMCTIVLFVDYNEISHKYPQEMKEVIIILKKHFEELTVDDSKKFDFLGMKITM